MDIDTINRQVRELMQFMRSVKDGTLAIGARITDPGNPHGMSSQDVLDSIEAVTLENAPQMLNQALYGLDVAQKRLSEITDRAKDLLDVIGKHLQDAEDEKSAEVSRKAAEEAQAEQDRIDAEAKAATEAKAKADEVDAKNHEIVDSILTQIVGENPGVETIGPEIVEPRLRELAPAAGIDADLAVTIYREDPHSED